MTGGGMTGINALVVQLEDYYRLHRTWEGVEGILGGSGHNMMQTPGGGMGPGMMAGQRIRLADPDGTLLVDTANSQAVGKLTASEMSGATPLKFRGKIVGFILPEGGMMLGLREQNFLLSRLNRAALLAALVAGGVSLILASLLAYRLLLPIQQLTRAAQNLAARKFNQRVPVSGGDELATLGNAFNQMAESLEQSEARRREMTADIAHELRTPLAVQRAHLEALQDGVYPLTQENLEPIHKQNLLLTRLVDDLRTLALAEAGQLTLEKLRTDLEELARRAIEHFEPQASSNQVQLKFSSLHLPAPSSGDQCATLINVDPTRIEQILGNLLANALRFTPEGGTIDLSLAFTSAQATVTIHDSGPGIPWESLPFIFERFYRADRSRSREEGGSGLGLAIARQLARAHGGDLTAANHPQGGAVFTLTLPCG